MAQKIVPVKVTVVPAAAYDYANNSAAGNDFVTCLGNFPWVGDVTLQLTQTARSATQTMDCHLTISLDGGTTYATTEFVNFTQTNGSTASEWKQITIPCGADVRIKTDINISASGTVTFGVVAVGLVAGPSYDTA